MTEVVLDVDTGVDDALAIAFAVSHPEVNVRCITCVSGNVGVAQVVVNTLKTLDVMGAPDIPVAAGADRPLLAPPADASHVHGADGLADLGLPGCSRTAVSAGALELARDRILDAPEPVTLVALGPLTNVALLLRAHPAVRENLERVLFMGGSASGGNATAVAEFNIWHDPEAAAIVVGSGVPLRMYGLDVFNQVTIDEETADRLYSGGRDSHAFVGGLLRHRMLLSNGGRAPYRGLLGDAGAVCALVEPEVVAWQRWPLQVELAGASRGQTVVDRRSLPGEDELHGMLDAWPSADIALGVDVGRMRRTFLEAIGFEMLHDAAGSPPA
jgi:pyrimidine-specific ribonucleoside hydrolase